ncbi:MAG: PAS domain S-box protein [Nitrospinae bacterium]|nr:PAS domain S-box protein [Nitrospinota bacterium]
MLTWFRNLKVGAKISLGFLLIILALLVSVLFSIKESTRVKVLTDQVVELRVPTALSSLSLRNGINRSLAALRGWMLLGEDRFKQERRRAWSEEIDKPLKTMKELSVNWTNPENAERLRIIESKLQSFRKYQQEIEDLAQTPENMRALQILAEQAAPTALAIEELLAKMTGNQQQLLQTDLDESHNLSKQTIFSLWVILFVGVSISGVMALLITRSISDPLRKITEFSKGIAAGDLKQEKLAIATSDELGVLSKNFNEMIADLEKKEGRITSIIEATVDPMIVIDERGIMETFNRAAEKTFGYSRSEVIGQNVKMLMPDPYHSEHDGYIKNYLNTGQAKIIGIGREVVGKRKDGSTFPLDLAINEMRQGKSASSWVSAGTSPNGRRRRKP